MRILCIILSCLILTACSSEEQIVNEPHGEVAALERAVTSPPVNRGQIQQVTSQDTQVEAVKQVNLSMTIDDRQISVPTGYTMEYVSDNGIPHFVLFSAQNDDTIEVFAGTLSSSISENEVADNLADWCIDNYYPNGQPKSIGSSTKSGTTFQNYINFTDNMTLTYFCIKEDIISVLHQTQSPAMTDLTTYILSATSSGEVSTPEVEVKPSDYLALQGGHYYTMNSIDKENQPGDVYMIFPLTDEKTTFQVFGKNSELVYDTYLMNNSMYYTGIVKVKLAKEHIIYVSKTTAVAKLYNSNTTTQQDEVSQNNE